MKDEEKLAVYLGLRFSRVITQFKCGFPIQTVRLALGGIWVLWIVDPIVANHVAEELYLYVLSNPSPNHLFTERTEKIKLANEYEIR